MTDVDPNSPIYVLSKNGTLVAAACLAQPQGGFVEDPNTQTVPIYQISSTGLPVQVTNSNNYLIVPADFTIASALNFASQIKALTSSPYFEGPYLAMILAFEPGGSQDLQRNYDGQTWNGNSGSGMFVLAFKDAASWYLGLVMQQAGIPVAAGIDGGKLFNALEGKGYQLDPNNINAINNGAAFGTSLPAGESLNADTVTVTTTGSVTVDNGSATIRGNNNQVALSGSDDTLYFTGSHDTFDLTDSNGNSFGSLTLSGGATVTVGAGPTPSRRTARPDANASRILQSVARSITPPRDAPSRR